MVFEFIYIFFSQASTQPPVHKIDYGKMELPKGYEYNYFDNGTSCIWYEPDKATKNIIFCVRGFTSIEKEFSNLDKLRDIFPGYEIVIMDHIFMNDYFIMSIRDLVEDLLVAYSCVLRLKKYDKIGFFGVEAGAFLISELYELALDRKCLHCNWIIHLNGIHSIESLIHLYTPWYIQALYYFQKNRDSKDRYKKCDLPIYLFHSKHNERVSFIESIQLHQSLKPKSKFIHLFGKHDTTLINKENRILITSITKNL
jgi:hypothetical protein